MSSGLEGVSLLSDPRKALLLALQPPEQQNISEAVDELFEFGLLTLPSEEEEVEDGEEVSDVMHRGSGRETSKDVIREWEAEGKDPLTHASVTPFGSLCHSVPLSFESCRLILLGGRSGRMIIHSIIMAVGESLPDLFIRPFPYSSDLMKYATTQPRPHHFSFFFFFFFLLFFLFSFLSLFLSPSCL
jgi:hypothetical protein